MRSFRLVALVDAKSSAVDGNCPASAFIHFDLNCIHLYIAFGHREFRRHLVQKPLQDALFVHADYRVMRTGHTNVRDVGRASGQDALISRSHMRMGSQDGGNFPGEIPAHGLLFRGGLRVHVHNNHFNV